MHFLNSYDFLIAVVVAFVEWFSFPQFPFHSMEPIAIRFRTEEDRSYDIRRASTRHKSWSSFLRNTSLTVTVLNGSKRCLHFNGFIEFRSSALRGNNEIQLLSSHLRIKKKKHFIFSDYFQRKGSFSLRSMSFFDVTIVWVVELWSSHHIAATIIIKFSIFAIRPPPFLFQKQSMHQFYSFLFFLHFFFIYFSTVALLLHWLCDFCTKNRNAIFQWLIEVKWKRSHAM